MNKNPASRQALKRLRIYRDLYNDKSGKENLRHLTQEEIEKLKSYGNLSSDWSLIEVERDFSADWIRGNIFSGKCILGTFDGKPVSNFKLPCGIYRSSVIGSRIEGGSLVADVSCLADSLVCKEAALLNTGTVSSASGSLFASGTKITVGCETGRREIMLTLDLNFDEAALIAINEKKQSTDYLSFASDIPEIGCIIEPFAVIQNCGKVAGSFICEGALLDGAVLVEDSAIFSSKLLPTVVSNGAVLRKSLIGEGCLITDMAIAEKSLISEYCTVTRHGKLTSCIVGPCTEIAEGEATSALIGPLTGLHHQALLIAALWPKGRGNIGYGANAGSNHTGRAPDQELICGEGLFIGLGTSIKFPANYQAAPYSIIATGVCTMPQKVELPFSLINSPSRFYSDIPPSYNEIFPGWVLENSIYSVIRNEKKFKDRDRSQKLQPEILRPETAGMMAHAKRLLTALPEKTLYTEKDIPEIGKNYMTGKSREIGIAAYDFYIRYCIGRELWKRLQALSVPSQDEELFLGSFQSREWEQTRTLLLSEGMSDMSIEALLKEYAAACMTIAEKAKTSKEKDDKRGRRVIDDYDIVSTAADKDPIISEAFVKAEETAAAVKRFTELNFDKLGQIRKNILTAF